MIGAVNDRPHLGPGSWRVRRRMVFLLIGFCMATITWVVAHDMKGRVAETVVWGSFGLLGAVSGYYIFGAQWGDNHILGGMRDRDDRTGRSHSWGGYSSYRGIGPDDEEDT